MLVPCLRNGHCSVRRRFGDTLTGVNARRQAIACCPACAASIRRRHRSRVPRAWVVLLALVAATLPIAALNDRDSPSAEAAPSPSPAPAPQPAPPPAAPIEARVQWRESIAHGTANTGWLERGVILPDEGPGFYTYDPYTQAPPNRRERRNGTATLVREIIDLGRWWERAYPDAPRLGIGDLSNEGGGNFDLHASHENGLDVDIRLPRADGQEGQSNPANYDRALTQALADRLVGRRVEYVFYGPNLDVRGPSGIVMTWPNHDDHLHVRFPDPDGFGN
jgi:hypothetical protein